MYSVKIYLPGYYLFSYTSGPLSFFLMNFYLFALYFSFLRDYLLWIFWFGFSGLCCREIGELVIESLGDWRASSCWLITDTGWQSIVNGIFDDEATMLSFWSSFIERFKWSTNNVLEAPWDYKSWLLSLCSSKPYLYANPLLLFDWTYEKLLALTYLMFLILLMLHWLRIDSLWLIFLLLTYWLWNDFLSWLLKL